MAHAFGQSLKQMERELLERISQEDQRMQAELTRLQDTEFQLQVKVNAEREVRASEAETWRSRHRALAADLEALLARRDAEVAELQSKVDSAIASREAEENTARRERQALQERAEGLAQALTVREAALHSAQRMTVQLEARLANAQSDRDRLQASVETLRQQVKLSDEALAEAVKSNEALREQMEIQRIDAQSASERELRLWREKFQQHLEDQEAQHQVEQVDLARRVQTLEELLGKKAGQIQALRESLAEKSKAKESLQRDLSMWKGQQEIAAKMKAEVEKDFEHFKEEFLGRRLFERKEEHEALRKKQADLQTKKSALEEEVRKLEADLQAQDLQEAQRQQGLAELRREVLAEAERTKQKLQEVEASLTAAKAEAAATQKKTAEHQERLEEELQRVAAESEAERRELERKIQAERQSCETLRRAAERRRKEQQQAYEAALDGPAQELATLEGSISEIQHTAELEISSLHQKSEKLRSRTEELEGELLRLQEKLAQSDKEVQDSTAQLTLAKARNRSSVETLQQEKVRKSERLQQVQSSTSQKLQRLELPGPRRAFLPLSPEVELRRSGASLTPTRSGIEDRRAGREHAWLTGHADLRRCLSEQRSRTRNLQDLSSRMHRSVMEERASLRQSFS